MAPQPPMTDYFRDEVRGRRLRERQRQRQRPAQRLLRSEIQAMRLAYDPATDSLYIHLSERPAADSDEVADGVVLDYDAAGTLVGIDVQRASERADLARLSVSHLPLSELTAA
jgi:uncharacterized protein YuzE